jgi:hypothetical protein
MLCGRSDEMATAKYSRARKLCTQESALCPIDEGELTLVTNGFLPGCAAFLLAPFGDSWMNPAILLNLLRILPAPLKSSVHSPASAPTLRKKGLKSVRDNPCSQAFMGRRNGHREWSFLLLFPARSEETWKEKVSRRCFSPQRLSVVRRLPARCLPEDPPKS